MIHFANTHTAPQIRSMWKICFGDSDAYIDLYFGRQYKNENTLLYWVDNQAVASLQMLPYQIRFYGEVIPFYYLAGLCTLPNYRGKGYMGQLIRKSFEVMQERNIPLTILVPAEEGLFGYYEKYDFQQTFEASNSEIGFGSFLERYPLELPQLYREFDNTFQQDDFCVLKSVYDFETIVSEFHQDNNPTKYNLAAMSHIIDRLALLRLYALKNTDKNFVLKVEDNVYQIGKGKATISYSPYYDLEVDARMLTRLLFGFRTEKLPSNCSLYFQEKRGIINLMLE